ncbi:MAG: phage tail protein [Shewanella sp.]|nr:phage tail protein [Shewanella sp.]
MSDVMLALGEFKFGINSAQYQSLKTAQTWRWAKKDRYGRKPGRQYHGPESMVKTLDIVIYPQDKADLARFHQLRAMADQGKPLRLVAGGARWVDGGLVSAGADLGLWVIESLNVDESLFMSDGTALEQKGNLVIAEYGDDAH